MHKKIADSLYDQRQIKLQNVTTARQVCQDQQTQSFQFKPGMTLYYNI